MIWYLNSKMDLNLSCAKDFRHLNYMLTWSINWRRLLALINFQRHSFKLFPINILSITLMYYNRLHAWWSTHSLLATLLSSLIARWWDGLQTLWRFRLKDLSINGMVGTWCFGCCQVHGGLPVGLFCSSIQFNLLLSLYLCFISFLFLDLYVLGDKCIDKLGFLHANQTSMWLDPHLN